MYLVKVTDFLKMEGVPDPHHVLRQKELLHQWQPGMFVIFISHQWLGAKSCDPNGKQLLVLRQALEAFIDGTMKVELDLMRTFGAPLEMTSYEQVADGYLFLDWFAIPQITARTDGVNDDATRSDAARAVQSIPAYVENCDLFLALVPELVHTDTKNACNYATWLSRGWCRAELWCRVLSNRKDTRLIVIFSAKEALFISPMDWQRNLISDGMFTVESDREVVAKLGEMALTGKIQSLLRWGCLDDYRFYLSLQQKLLDQTKQTSDLPSFLEHFKFPSMEAAVKDQSGMTGMLCAILSSDVEILETLVQQKANVNGRVTGLRHLGYSDTVTLLMVALYSGQDLQMVSKLMTLKADPNLACVSDSGSIITTSWLVCRPDYVQVLLEYRADFNTSNALVGVVGNGSVETVQALLEARCDPMNVPANGFGPMISTGFFGRGNHHACDNMKLLLAARGDANERAEPKGQLYWDCLKAQVCVKLHGLDKCGVYQRQLASLPGATALSIAAVMGDKALVQLLLEHDAEHIKNERGDSPEDLARAGGHTDLLPILSTFAV